MSAPSKVRIVGGIYKRTPLTVPDLVGLRPTPDRVRETLFNWLTPYLEGARCLDLFAGTGALGIESVSRGAKSAVLVESQRQAVVGIEDTLRRLKSPASLLLKAQSADAFLQSTAGPFDLVFLDPPFASNWLDKVLPELIHLLSANAKVYVESEKPLLDTLVRTKLDQAWIIERAAKAGQVYYHLMRLRSPDEQTTSE